MEDISLSATTGDTFNGHSFEQTTTATGAVSYSIDGAEVDRATWDKAEQSAEEEEIRRTAGPEEDPDL
ncbi:MAG: hypothetical protein EOP06_19540 [Proteobacteria bacterium]|nr:MAG: hypothetical protein EOP06_19540 [Pseudomonadota bacterium]